VATDFRLYVKRAAGEAVERITALMRALVQAAEREFGVILPAYTHLQRALPVLFSHHLLAYVEMLQRDRKRFLAARQAADVCPLGSGACAGNQFQVDRELLQRQLGFGDITRNSMDAVSDRDFAADYLYAAALLMVHLSRFAEDLILWSSSEFGLVRLDDAVTTGSSMMPQKRNADAAELARGKAGRVAGHLIGLLMTLKGLPLTYNKDLQEDKEPVFDVADTLALILPVFQTMVETMTVNAERARALLRGGFLEATAVADYLTRKGVPFREAHRLAGKAVLRAEKLGLDLPGLPLEEYRALSPHFDQDLYGKISLEATLRDKTVIGGTAPERVRGEIERLKQELAIP
jgi:argininosuccinate lyase